MPSLNKDLPNEMVRLAQAIEDKKVELGRAEIDISAGRQKNVRLAQSIKREIARLFTQLNAGIAQKLNSEAKGQ